MSEPDTNPTPDPASAKAKSDSPAPKTEVPSKPNSGSKSTSIGVLVVLGVIVATLTWYLLADRYTPYTSQARVQGYIVGVAPKVPGLVTEVWVENNQEVQPGDRLFQIDTETYAIALQSAQSNLENTRRQVQAGGAVVDSARAHLEAAKANAVKAQKDFERLTRLRETDPGTISMRRLELSQATLKSALAQVVAAEADIQRAIEQRGGLDDENNALLQAAEAAVEKAELDLANTTVVAASRGIISDLQAEVGLFAGTGTPVLTLISMHDVWISAEYKENNLGHMEAGQTVDVVFDSLPGKIFKGHIRSVGLGVSAGSQNAAGTLPSLSNDRDWLRQSQRFPVIVSLEPNQGLLEAGQIRIGGQTTVITYTGSNPLLNFLGRQYIRMASILSYAY